MNICPINLTRIAGKRTMVVNMALVVVRKQENIAIKEPGEPHALNTQVAFSFNLCIFSALQTIQAVKDGLALA